MDDRKNVLVLRLNAPGGIDHQHADIAVFDGPDRTHDRIELQVFVDLRLFADTGRIDQVKLLAKLVVFGVNRVARGTGHIGHNVAVDAHKRIDQRRFAGIRTTDHGDTRKRTLVGVDFFRFGQQPHNFIEQIARSRTRHRRNAHRIAQPEAVKFGRLVLQVVVVGFVGHQQHRFFDGAQRCGHILVEFRHPVLHIHHKQDDIGFFDGDGHLTVDGVFEDVVATGYQAAGIHQRKPLVPPLHLTVLTVAGGARLIAHNGAAGFGQTIKKGGFPDIGTPHNGY